MTAEIERLRKEIAQLETTIDSLANMPEQQLLLHQRLDEKQVALARLTEQPGQSVDVTCYAWLRRMAHYYGAALNDARSHEELDAEDAQHCALIPLPDVAARMAVLRDTRQKLVEGICLWSDLSMPPAQPDPHVYDLLLTWVLWPLIDWAIDGQSLERHGPHTLALTALADTSLPVLVGAYRELYWAKDANQQTRDALVRTLTDELADHDPFFMSGLCAVLGYLSSRPRWEQLLQERQRRALDQQLHSTLQARMAAAPERKELAWLQKALVETLKISATAGLTAGILHTLSHPPTAHPAEPQVAPPPAPSQEQATPTPPANDPPPDQIASLVIPITPAEWSRSLQARDTRYGRHGLRQSPVPYWCYVPAGRYRIGGWEKDDSVAYHDLAAFWIGRVPVTLAQYRYFMQAGGYTTRQWWTDNGWEWKLDRKRAQPWRWDGGRFTKPTQPVIGVSWYEATAFCSWLHAQLHAPIPAGYGLRLPTEAEWETAASAGDGRRYPWGNSEPSPALADYGRKWEEGARPVGGRPRGAAACGALDMAGTVWEPTCSAWSAYPQQASRLVKDFTVGSGDIPWRGGAYWNDSTSVRCGARLRNAPNDFSVGSGFRVIVASPLAR